VADCDRFFKSICGKNIFLAFSIIFSWKLPQKLYIGL
jgi:hypothetical protein